MTAGLSESSFGPIQKVRQVKYVYRYFDGCGNWGILALKILHLKICWRISFQIWYPLFPRTSLVLLFPMFNVWIIYENNHDVVRYSIYSKNSKLFMGKLEKNIISLRLELYNSELLTFTGDPPSRSASIQKMVKHFTKGIILFIYQLWFRASGKWVSRNRLGHLNWRTLFRGDLLDDLLMTKVTSLTLLN